jgi:ribosomal protein S18 acetylase RimI-like enzyme
MDAINTVVRRAREEDIPTLGRLGALLMKTHYDFDRLRFIEPGRDAAEGYAWFLRSQMNEEDAVIFVAERAGTAVGYIYAAVEPRSWKDLRDTAGFIHDLIVEESSRRMGIARLLFAAAVQWLQERGMPRVVLGTAEQNKEAQRLFERLGFRRTMIEMTRELVG